MLRFSAISILLAATLLSGCSLPPPRNPALQQDGAFPNLGNVPDRPRTSLSSTERAALEAELTADNKAQTEQLAREGADQ